VTLASTAILLFLVIDPLGNLPFFVSALQQVDPARRWKVVVREMLLAYGVMVGFLFAGKPVLALLHISEPALSIAGGVILFLIALRMVFPPPGRGHQEEVDGEPFLVPLAIPYVAGPSVLATELLLMSREPERWPSWLAALSLAWAATAVILVLGSQLSSRLGPRGLVALERLMGMVLVAIAIQMFLSGVETYVRQVWPVAAP
jgi:multiple antibiotic resistance protein